jgi:hypothetical protein
MEINIRKNAKYADVNIDVDSTKVDLGLMDENEAGVLIQTLISAAQELEHIFRPDSTLDNLLVAAHDVSQGEIL